MNLTVYAPGAGNYTLYVGYADLCGDARHTHTVNGGAQQVVGYPDRGRDNRTRVAVGVTLHDGRNTLRLQHRQRWAEVDSVELA